MRIDRVHKTMMNSRFQVYSMFLFLMLIGVLILDGFTPLGTAVGVLYVLVVVATLPLHSHRLTVCVSVLASVLILLGYLISPQISEFSSAGLNRILSLAAVGLATWTVWQAICRTLAFQELQQSLQRQVEERTKELEEKHRATLNLLEDLECAKHEISQKEKQYRLIIEAAPEGMLEINKKGQMVLVNAKICSTFGYTRDELLDQPVGMLFPERFHGSQAEHGLDHGDHPQLRALGAHDDLYGVCKDGSEFPIEIGLNPVFINGSAFTLASVVDITQRKQTEAELKGWTAKLAQSNRDLDDFAYITSHDLKEPLRGILNYSGFLVEDYGRLLGEEGRQKCQVIMDLSSRMEGLINTLLQFSRLGKSDLEFHEVDLDTIVSDVLVTLQPCLDEQGITIRCHGPLPKLSCDEARVGEIFRNLITNAMKYNDKAEKVIEVGYALPRDRTDEAEHTGEGRLEHPTCFYVRDNGIGISEKQYTKIFQIFRRLHGRDKFGGGTGAGLAIAKKIVDRHGGKIWVESVVGEGTTFWFTLAPEIDEKAVQLPEVLTCHSS